MNEDRSKLPRWARHLIEKLEADIEHERKRNAVIDAGESDTWIETHVPTFGTKTYLPKGSIVKFKTNGGVISIYVRPDHKQGNVGELDVNATRSLIVRPNSSNLIFLEVEE